MNEEDALMLVKTMSQFGQSFGQPGDFGYDLGAKTEAQADQMLSQVKYEKQKKEQEKKKKGGLYGTIGSIAGTIAGGPIGGAVGGALGSYAGGGDLTESAKSAALNAGINYGTNKAADYVGSLTTKATDKAAEASAKGTEKPDVEPIKTKTTEDVVAKVPLTGGGTPPLEPKTATGQMDAQGLYTAEGKPKATAKAPGYIDQVKGRAAEYFSDPQNVSNLISLTGQAFAPSEPTLDTRGLSPEAAEQLTNRVAQEQQLEQQGSQIAITNRLAQERGARDERRLDLEEQRLTQGEALKPLQQISDIPIVNAAGRQVGSSKGVLTFDPNTNIAQAIPIGGTGAIDQPKLIDVGGVFMQEDQVRQLPPEAQIEILSNVSGAKAGAAAAATQPFKQELLNQRLAAAAQNARATGQKIQAVDWGDGTVHRVDMNSGADLGAIVDAQTGQPGAGMTPGQVAQDMAAGLAPQEKAHQVVQDRLAQGGFVKTGNGLYMFGDKPLNTVEQAKVASVASLAEFHMINMLNKAGIWGQPMIGEDGTLFISYPDRPDLEADAIGKLPIASGLPTFGAP